MIARFTQRSAGTIDLVREISDKAIALGDRLHYGTYGFASENTLDGAITGHV